MKRKSKPRRRHVDSSDDDDDPQYDIYVDDAGKVHSKPLPTSAFPRYTVLNPLEKPDPIPSIKPDNYQQQHKEMLQMLSGLFSWDLFLSGKKKPKCELQPEFLEAAKVRKQESSWKQSVTRRTALSIEEAVVNKDLSVIYDKMLRRRQVMEAERDKAHFARREGKLPPLAHITSMRRCSSQCSGGGERMTATSMSTGRSSRELPPPRASTSLGSTTANDLLLLNDDMLIHEAHQLVAQAARGMAPSRDAVVAHATLRHRSLTPLRNVLVVEQRNQGHADRR
jgi:hypothetical protein